MSSLIGHSFAGWILSRTTTLPEAFSRVWPSWLWQTCLMGAAIAPDFDYLIPFLQSSAHDGIRITHSVSFALLLPGGIALVVFSAICLGLQGAKTACILTLAGLSHLMLDLLVGVSALPLIWPLTDQTVKLPFGLLPSAGKLSLTNFFLYRNLLIELGVLLPIGLSLLIGQSKRSRQHRLPIIIGLLATSIVFMNWAHGLSR